MRRDVPTWPVALVALSAVFLALSLTRSGDGLLGLGWMHAMAWFWVLVGLCIAGAIGYQMARQAPTKKRP